MREKEGKKSQIFVLGRLAYALEKASNLPPFRFVCPSYNVTSLVCFTTDYKNHFASNSTYAGSCIENIVSDDFNAKNSC